jgi:CheY-like chemotaxis protein
MNTTLSEKGIANKDNTARGVPVKTGSILVIDDKAAYRNIISSLLTRHGYSVIEAADGFQALSICSNLNCKIDLIIVDIIMPELDGFDLIAQIRKIRSDFRVIYRSDHIDPVTYQEQARTLAEGKNLLKKPFRLSHLLQMVDNALGRRHG